MPTIMWNCSEEGLRITAPETGIEKVSEIDISLDVPTEILHTLNLLSMV